MLVEPPGPLVPAGAGLTTAAVGPLRTAASVAAAVLAVLSRGDVIVLAALLALAAWRLPAVAAAVPALLATAWRWGSTSLEALAGAQAVIGPAGWTGPTPAAVSSWLAAAALVLAVPGRQPRSPIEPGGMGDPLGAPDAPNPLRSVMRRRGRGMGGPQAPAPGAPSLLGALAAGAAAAAVVAGPAPGGALWVRVLATIVATGLAVAVHAQRAPRLGAVIDGAAVVAGLGALALAGLDAPALSGTLDGPALRTGAALALAVAGLAVVGERTVTAMRRQRA